jgi:uridine kinase
LTVGKTTLADELALLLRSRGREVIRASAESFHLPRAQRYRHGEFSPEANYHDSFDYDALRRVLLDPLGPDGDRRYQHAVYDLDTDTALSPPATTAPADAVLLLDGVFLLRPELIGRWNLSIFVSAAFERILDRARIRDLARLGSAAEVERRFRTRYIPRTGIGHLHAHAYRHTGQAWWGGWGSNPRPADYESAALTC